MAPHGRNLLLSICMTHASLIVAGSLCNSATAQSGGQPKEPPIHIIAGDPVSPADEQNLGLITVGGGCSGTPVNRAWVLTADHCDSADAQIAVPPADLATLTLTASWSRVKATPTAVVRYAVQDPGWGGNPGFPGGKRYAGHDVALLFLGNQDFGAVRTQLFYTQPVDENTTVMAYGRGITAYATGKFPIGPPAQQDGKYRSAIFAVYSAVVGTNYTLWKDAGGRVIAGGDSGGPDIAMGVNVALGITGVHSSCSGVTLAPSLSALTPPPGPPNWNWVTGVQDCTSAALYNIRDDIVQRIQTHPTRGAVITAPGGWRPPTNP